MFVNALKKCPEYLDKLNKLINIKKLDSFEDIDFINDSDAFKLFNLKIFKERSVSVENGESLNETKSKIMKSYQQISFSLENEPKIDKRFSLYDVISMINSNDSQVLETIF
jgi:hypothetical protein